MSQTVFTDNARTTAPLIVDLAIQTALADAAQSPVNETRPENDQKNEFDIRKQSHESRIEMRWHVCAGRLAAYWQLRPVTRVAF
ncbi:MAG TPA: hypothetical protein VKM94_21980 [Blastocatellia bacterium]|nr:hypothetical protein [Blastocatellia bacterium]